ncbi:MAG: hypothetical protein ACJ76D_02130 [Solirubrobacterales bacterium]
MSSTKAEEARGKATLREVGRSGANGVATFSAGALGDTRMIQIHATGLEPTGGIVYGGWLIGPSAERLALATFQVGRDGKLSTQLETSATNIESVEDGALDEVLVTKGTLDQISAALDKALEPASGNTYMGAPVMRGPITGPLSASPTG